MVRGHVGVVLLCSLLISAVDCAQSSSSQVIKDGPAISGASPSPPVWPELRGSQRMRVDVFGGMDRTVTLQDTSYLLYPRINVTVCDTIRDDVGPTAAGGTAATTAAAAVTGHRGLSKALLDSAVSTQD
ncbi:hypothetical protein COO60DRAFT_184731 [Scenedesmus sp. NREL 46B-D3]|nr:hypothetical protein COO60DRAFT_184731 [Scenedesmus sp. NREL 46B-D3]